MAASLPLTSGPCAGFGLYFTQPQRRNVMSVAVAQHAKRPGAAAKHKLKAVREAYYDKISKHDMAPLWEVLKNVVTSEPKTKCVPQIWKFADVKRLMLEAGDVITTEEAERRVLVLENPGLPRTNTIYNSSFE